jgi:O-antigen/teichoic acid export membrane protein
VNAVFRYRGHATQAAWAVADQGISPLVQLVITPLLLAKLGRDAFGTWVLAITLISMSQLVSFGAGTAATKHVSADSGAGNRSHAIAVIRASLSTAILGGTLAALGASVFALPIAAFFFAQMGSPAHIAPVLALCGLATAIQEIDNVYVGAMRGVERFDLCAKVEVPARISMGAVIAYLAWRGATVIALVWIFTAMMALKAGLKSWQVAALFETPATYLPTVARMPLARVWRFGVWQWAQSAGTVMFTATDQLLIGSLLGAGPLASYAVCLQIAQYVHMLPSVMMQVIFPRISALGAGLEPETGNRILLTVTLLAFGIALTLGLPIILLAYPLLKLWVGAEFAASNHLLLMVLVAVHIALAINIGGYFVLLGTGRSARSSVIVLIAGAAQSIFAIVAAPFGILAVACNRLIYALITAHLYFAARFKKSVR